MNREDQLREAKRWFNQAKDDLAAARVLASHQKFAQSCFLCQQSGEKAAKALWYGVGGDPWGHSVARLLEDLEDETLKADASALRPEALVLDRLYIPTRYPNGLPELTPKEAYGKTDTELASQAAEKIIEFVRSKLDL